MGSSKHLFRQEASNGTATGPGASGPAGQRWEPSEASPAALAAKALAECEEAEPYNERVRGAVSFRCAWESSNTNPPDGSPNNKHLSVVFIIRVFIISKQSGP